ncbi:hypothetical protein [Undibacterium sp.]|uniref:hypothetical protein n=1 Tax=Undibacterium sp. TaxID=1914977 RepID=UPI00272FA77E|nr:hypothetical protein [Undibacterium sp.]MDP1980499.1 hypothetical protein [Undibacterium sp.]
MTDPKIIKAVVTINYTADDGTSSSVTYKEYPADAGRNPPCQPLIDGLEELARLTTLFKFENKALVAFHEARKKVFIWRSKRETASTI